MADLVAAFNGDAVIACADLVGRCGATKFQIGYLHDDVPIEEAGWYAHAQYRGARITVDDRRSPSEAALALAERLLRGAACRCGKTVTLNDDGGGCRWQLQGKKWQPGCDVPPLHVDGPRGDLAAMNRAMNRAARRAEGNPACAAPGNTATRATPLSAETYPADMSRYCRCLGLNQGLTDDPANHGGCCGAASGDDGAMRSLPRQLQSGSRRARAPRSDPGCRRVASADRGSDTSATAAISTASRTSNRKEGSDPCM